jgi:hypothetical protein
MVAVVVRVPMAAVELVVVEVEVVVDLVVVVEVEVVVDLVVVVEVELEQGDRRGRLSWSSRKT